ncbi:hypothetical protein AgCh_016676 [Apium graveolens]
MGSVYGKCHSRCTSKSDGHRLSSDDRASDDKNSPYHGQGKHIIVDRSVEHVFVPSYNFELDYTVLRRHGYYPDTWSTEPSAFHLGFVE